MTERRRRGASRSSNCFQTSSAFGFLAFIVRSRVGIRGVESFTSKRKDERLNTPSGSRQDRDLRSGQAPNTGAEARKSQRKEKLGAGDLGRSGPERSRVNSPPGQRPSRGDAAQKKRAKARWGRSFTQDLLYQNESTLQALVSRNSMSPGPRNTNHAPASACYTARTSLNWTYDSGELPNSQFDGSPRDGAGADGRRDGYPFPPRHPRSWRMRAADDGVHQLRGHHPQRRENASLFVLPGR